MIARCPHCGKKLKINDKLAGKRGACPACKQAFTIPAVSAKLPIDQKTPQAPPPVPPAPPTSAKIKQEPKAEAQMTPHARRPETEKTSAPTAPPPLPPKPPAKTETTGRPSSDTVALRASTSSALNQVISSLVRALSVKKLGFFLLAAIAMVILCGFFLWIGAASNSDAIAIVCFIIVGILVIGAIGPLAGGVAYLTRVESQGRSVGIADAFRFCGRRFLALIGGIILLLLILVILPLIVNGFVALLNSNRTVGSFVGALLFLPQFLFNLMCTVAVLVGILVPCAIAVENIGAFRAISRLIACMRFNTGQLMVQIALTFFFVGVVMFVLWLLVGIAMVPTVFTNGPSFTSSIGEVDQLWGSRGEDHSLGFDFGSRSRDDLRVKQSRGGAFGWPTKTKHRSGEILRCFFVAVILLLVIVYPVVYWIVSFTTYYMEVQPKIATISRARQRAGP